VGLRVSRVGVVLVTPSMLAALRSGGFADQALGATRTRINTSPSPGAGSSMSRRARTSASPYLS
jgi:hypothetical protein